MPFGLQGAPATFQRMMDVLLKGIRSYAGAYLDDLVVFSNSWEEHSNNLEPFCSGYEKPGSLQKTAKCQFGMQKIVCLGHLVGNGEVRPEQQKIEAVTDFPRPVIRKDVRSFLGHTGYYRKFVPNYAVIALPLTDCTKKNAPTNVNWTDACEAAFTELKRRLTSVSVLSPDLLRPFILQTDASERGIGAVLSQHCVEGEEHPVSCYSRKVLPREERYATVEKECLATDLCG